MDWKKNLGAYLFLLPAGMLLFLFFFIPFFQTIYLSFFDFSSDAYKPDFVLFYNYLSILKSPLFLKTVLNTFYFLICKTNLLSPVSLYLNNNYHI